MSHEYRALVERLRETLTKRRYNPVVVQNYCRNADYFLRYLAERRVALEATTPTEVADYLRLAVQQFRERRGRAPARHWISVPRSGIHRLSKLALKRWPPEPAATDAGELLCREVCDQYQTWLREQRGLAAASIYALMWETRYETPPARIVPVLADEGIYIASESSFHRVLRGHGQMNRRGRARPPRASGPLRTHIATRPGEVWCWDVTFLPTQIQGRWFYFYLILDLYSQDRRL